MKKRLIYLLTLFFVLGYGCQKELSLESGNNPSEGGLQSNVSGDCLPKTVNGSYVAGTALAPSINTIAVQVNVTKTGSYLVSTDTINGYFFRGTGTFTAVGLITVTLRSSGIPLSAGTNNFVVRYDSSSCNMSVTVLPAGSGGPAVFTLTATGSPASCTAIVNGNYVISTALSASNSVSLSVNVTTIGTYNISTTFQGMTFSKSGTFTVTGIQTVLLDATGTPTTLGANNVPITAGNSSCSFVVTVVAVVPIDYYPRTTNSNWSYEFNDNIVPADTLLRKVFPQTLTVTPNIYNIFMANDGKGTGFDSSGYYRKSGGDYFEYFDIGSFIGFDPPSIWSEYIMLKDNVPVGTVWNSNGITGTATIPPPTTFTIRFKYSILQKDVPITIVTSLGTKTYQNVIVVKEEYQQFDGTNWNDITPTVGSGKSYYARGVGLIKFEAFDGLGTLVFLQELRRYEVF